MPPLFMTLGEDAFLFFKEVLLRRGEDGGGEDGGGEEGGGGGGEGRRVEVGSQLKQLHSHCNQWSREAADGMVRSMRCV